MVATPCLLASTAALPVRNSMAPQPRRQFACVRLRQDELFAFASSAEKGPGFGAPRAVGGWRTKESAESSFAMFAACVTVGRQTLHSKASLGRMHPVGRREYAGSGAIYCCEVLPPQNPCAKLSSWFGRLRPVPYRCVVARASRSGRDCRLLLCGASHKEELKRRLVQQAPSSTRHARAIRPAA